MLNAEVRLIPPIWSEDRDNGGMFPSRLSVHQDPDGGPRPFLAVCRDSWGGGAQARRATEEEARAHAEHLFEEMFG
jgi:hypothetical protein